MSRNSPVIVDLKFDPAVVAKALSTAFADREVINIADPATAGRDLGDIDYAIVWNPDPDLFGRARDLKVIFSGGAGVDKILSMAALPDVPVVRFVDPSLTTRMSEWIVLQCLTHLRQVSAYARQQRARVWHELSQPAAEEITVGVMGLGILGRDAVAKLQVMGFNVIGWSRTKKTIDGIETYDAAGLETFLGKTDFLVGLLPLTPDTTGMFNARLFAGLRQGGALGKPVFINAGRGRSQVETDLVAALNSGILGAASLDVFEQEPLSQESPIWAMDNVVLTPHAAAASDERALFRYVESQIRQYEQGGSLDNLVDRAIGY